MQLQVQVWRSDTRHHAGQGEGERGSDKEVHDDDGQHDQQGAGLPGPQALAAGEPHHAHLPRRWRSPQLRRRAHRLALPHERGCRLVCRAMALRWHVSRLCMLCLLRSSTNECSGMLLPCPMLATHTNIRHLRPSVPELCQGRHVWLYA